jgi:hypothetical protein
MGKVQGRYREGTGKVQGRYREGTGKVQGRYREGTGKAGAAELERDLLEVGLAGGLDYLVADHRGASEANLLDVGVTRDQVAGGGAVAVDDVDHARGEACAGSS